MTITKSIYKYRVSGWRTGLDSTPQTFVHTLEQAAQAAIKIQAELMAFDKHMTGLGPCNVRVEPLDETKPLPVSDQSDAQIMAQDAAQWQADLLATRINMHRETNN